MNKSIAFKSLGCKLNQYEIQALREGFLKHGFTEVSPKESADYYVINTCTVTETADKEARRAIRSWNRRSPQAKILVTGCYATASPQEIASIPGVTQLIDNRSKSRMVSDVLGVDAVTKEESPFFEEGISYFEDRSRAFVKIQDGCNYFCRFCKIPYVRGRLVSREDVKIVQEVRRLRDYGYKEIVLSGVCLGSFGKDRNQVGGLVRLIEQILDVSGDFRVRLSSIDPRDTSLDLAKLMKKDHRLSAHLHLSLQSGDDGVLKRMARGYTKKDFMKLVENLRREKPDLGFSTDIIVGFPGEDEKAFEETRDFLNQIRFHRVHVFPYSERPQTKAVKLEGKVDPNAIAKRVEILKRDIDELTQSILSENLERDLEVLVEGESPSGEQSGFSSEYYRCVFTGAVSSKGSLVKIKPIGLRGHAIVGERLNNKGKMIPSL